MKATAIVLAAGVAGGSPGCGADGICDPAELEQALSDAEPGDTVSIGDCALGGRTFRVPAGVTLSGQGIDASGLAAPPGAPAVVMTPGAQPTTLKNLNVISKSSQAVVAEGSGAVRVTSVRVSAGSGIAIRVRGASVASLSQVELRGPTQGSEVDFTASDHATHGVWMTNVNSATLEAVTADGFTGFGAAFEDTDITWRGGSVSDNVAAGIGVFGGHASLHDLEVCRIHKDPRNEEIPAYGAVFVAGASIESTALEVCDVEGVGLFHDSATAKHDGLIAHDNVDVAVQVQHATGFTLLGAALTSNQVAGVVVIESSNVSIQNTTVTGSVLAQTLVGGNGQSKFGDGIELLRSTAAIHLQDVTLDGNQRVGLLLDLGAVAAADADVSFAGVVASGGALGAIGQDDAGVFVTASGWDQGIARDAATAANDLAQTSRLDEVGIVPPVHVPDPDGI